MRVTSGRTDPVLSRILVDNSKDTVFWMNEVGGVKMEPAITVAGVKKGNVVVWPRGLVVRAQHEGVGLSRSWFATVQKARHRAALRQRRDGTGRRRPGPRRRRQGARRPRHAIDSRQAPWCSAAAASRPTCRCARSISARSSVQRRCAARRTTRATACAWRWPSAPCRGASGAAVTRRRSAPTGAISHRASTPTAPIGCPTIYGLMINRRGRRFVDEGEDQNLFTYAKFGRAILAEPGAKGYQLFDSKVLHLLEPRYSTSKPITAHSMRGAASPSSTSTTRDSAEDGRGVTTPHAHQQGVRSRRKKDGHATRGLAIDKTNWATAARHSRPTSPTRLPAASPSPSAASRSTKKRR